MSSLEDLLKRELGVTSLQRTGEGGGGCISQGTAYETENGKIFVKFNNKDKADLMFEGEYESLIALSTANEVRVPKPIKVIRSPKAGAMLVMEYVDIQPLSHHAAKLGEQMARLHLHNSTLGAKRATSEQSIHQKYSGYVDKFGFPVQTCCGFLPQENNYEDDWVTFFAKKIDQHVKLAGDREAEAEWNSLSQNLHKMFKGLDIKPALLHGDLWGGNAGSTDDGPVIFDPASFYGHAEYDLAISKMFGGFGKAYFSSYHTLLPQLLGFDDRQELYMMFHYFNHWNHFGGGYRGSTLKILKQLAKKYS
ncbi:ketosamine-3-kinase-like [Physella acuta]|uniref:ketosamine-3-kinase-like n=1 Tax=Physella acuta TaxID=109671 RepID=UPI0027DC9CC8|nr:ketosamine-3-kinase-like [Physella acuta]XP_059149642.1 ketosamine-3-kinase-like [Physella acuta]XP_059149643.1 ketosamine-3-kinase-like [Physella acuta]XP_059149644.1 ketosamine-3-kinase-like [Physella acuta]